MPRLSWSDKRERQYQHVKESQEQRGRSEDTAEEIAARTVNKERARTGEAKQSSRLSRSDMSSGRRGGMRSHAGAGGRTVAQLRQEASTRGIRGYSRMRKAELERMLRRD
ncbi:MAG: Rho termination factor N-terminal domain-containing protein [Candidatus Dormiibacterota bacterium]